jgi:hypothetical protein
VLNRTLTFTRVGIINCYTESFFGYLEVFEGGRIIFDRWAASVRCCRWVSLQCSHTCPSTPFTPTTHHATSRAIHHPTLCPSFELFLSTALHGPRPPTAAPGDQRLEQVSRPPEPSISLLPHQLSQRL